MKSNKDISDLIRENAHKLEQKPSKSAWDRLENRLDQNASTPRFSIRKILSVAATVIGLISIGVVLSLNFLQKAPEMATNDIPVSNDFKIEEMKVLAEEEKGFYEVVEFQQTYQNRLSNPIIEGSGKKLSVAKQK